MRPVFLFLVLIAGLILQATLFVQKPFSWFQPSLTVLILLFIAYYRGAFLAMMLGILTGLVQDVVYGSFIGMHTFSLGVTGYFAGALFRVFLNRSLIMLVFVILGFSAVYEFMNYGIAMIFGRIQVDLLAVLTYAVRLMIFNGIFALILYPLADKWFPEDEDWGLGEEYL
ncbi:rod shape-determining protein MreD [Effusibacillus lacus]|uniref:Rod shape-determining protein MreD n=1 Tax=Effusibacillus lacus TaxID=1348429 RepID=A0A292YMR3_9BACL|nr:rod shape-determining protein MreD [Effusibacillus lacus]TCS76499.1 rod shape-determining protein MreD [Effusibacillus lacus]GAX90476.1 rod shape-determining protein MreD [Effusibacillus lacus]